MKNTEFNISEWVVKNMCNFSDDISIWLKFEDSWTALDFTKVEWTPEHRLPVEPWLRVSRRAEEQGVCVWKPDQQLISAERKEPK